MNVVYIKKPVAVIIAAGFQFIQEGDEYMNTDTKKGKITASHIMLYIILGIYVAVSLMCLIFMSVCTFTGNYENVSQVLIPCVSLIGACSCTVVGFYTNKASKENEIKLSNEKYRMRLEIAKDIFKEYGSTLDDKCIELLRKLMSDTDIREMLPVERQPQQQYDLGYENSSTWQNNINTSDNIINYDSEGGLG